MTIWLPVAVLVYLMVGVVCLLVCDRWSRQFEGDERGRMTVLGATVITVCWPLLITLGVMDGIRRSRR